MNYLLETHFFFCSILKKRYSLWFAFHRKKLYDAKRRMQQLNMETLPFYKLIFHFLKIANQVNFEHVLPKNLCSRNNFC